MIAVAQDTLDALAGISAGRAEALEEALEPREPLDAASGLDARASALVRIATLIAVDAPPASYAWQVTAAVEAGVGAEEILGVLRAIAPQVGAPRVVAAAPEIMLALGLSLPNGAD